MLWVGFEWLQVYPLKITDDSKLERGYDYLNLRRSGLCLPDSHRLLRTCTRILMPVLIQVTCATNRSCTLKYQALTAVLQVVMEQIFFS